MILIPLPRCAVNATTGSRDVVDTALEGFCDSLASSSSDQSSHVQVENRSSRLTSVNSPKQPPRKSSSHIGRIDAPVCFQIDDFQPRDVRTHFELPFPVNYVSRCLPSVPYAHEDFPR